MKKKSKQIKNKPYEFDTICLHDLEGEVLSLAETLQNYADEALKAGYKEARLELDEEQSWSLIHEPRVTKYFKVMFY